MERINPLGKTGNESIEEEIKQYQHMWLQNVQRTDEIEYHNKQCDMNQNGEWTLEDGGIDGETNFIFRIKE